MPRLFDLAYRLRTHRFGAWGLDRWIVTVAWVAAGWSILRWLLARRPQPSLLAGLACVLLLGLGIGVLVIARLAARRDFVVFNPEPALTPPAAARLAPNEKLPVCATGHFEVEGREAFFAGLLAYWRTFETGEHAVMAIVHPSRFLLLGSLPVQQLGLWYLFFMPDAVEGVAAGSLDLADGRTAPALSVAYRDSESRPDGKRPPRMRRRAAHLVFDDEATRTRVWADLLAG